MPADTDFILALAPRFVAFPLPRGRRKRGTLAGIRADLERTLCAALADSPYFVATGAGGAPTGFVHLVLQRDFFTGAATCHVSDLAVARGHDGRGIGRALLAFAEAFARAHACTLLTLSVFPGNVRAAALYARAGFTPDLVRMLKPLRAKR
jgi:ribosomal protein S18 acetylase RimI-like enzyme